MKIDRTNNFWLDNGILGLFKILSSKDEYWDKVELLPNALIINLEGDELVEALNIAKAEVTKEYLTKTKGVGWYYKDSEFHVYEKTDFKMHLKSFFTGKVPSTEGSLVSIDAKNSEVSTKGRKMTDEEYKKFISFKEKITKHPTTKDSIKFQNKGFINSPPFYDIGSSFNISYLNEGKKVDALTGIKSAKETNVSGMNYPFLTSGSGELNFSSHLKLKLKISSLFDFISIFSFYKLFYSMQNDLKHYFILYDSNLSKLSSFLDVINWGPSQITNSTYSNFSQEINGTQYENESLFNFIISIFQEVKRNLDLEAINGDLYTKRIFTFTNDGNIFRDVQEYGSLSFLFKLFNSYRTQEGDEINYLPHFLNFIKNFNQRLDSGKYNSILREKLCEKILNFKSIHEVVEQFLSDVRLREKKGGIPYLNKIITIYNQETQKHMKTTMVESCKSIGNSIGAYCRKSEDKGILFSIRNSKNRAEFLQVLENTQSKIMSNKEVEYKLFLSEDFFKSLPDDETWLEYKSLVSIFAMNSFLWKEKKENKDNNKK